MRCLSYPLPSDYNQENLEGLTAKRNSKDKLCVHPQLNVDCIVMFAMFCNVDCNMFILQNFYLHKFKMKI